MTSCSLVWLQLVVTSRYDRCFRNLFFLSSFLPSPRSRYTITLRCCPTRSVWSTIFLPGSLHYSYRSAKKQKNKKTRRTRDARASVMERLLFRGLLGILPQAQLRPVHRLFGFHTGEHEAKLYLPRAKVMPCSIDVCAFPWRDKFLPRARK